MTIKQYKKISSVIHALEWTGKNFDEIKEFTADVEVRINTLGKLCIFSRNMWINAEIGDMIIKGIIDNDIYPCDPLIFKLTYEEIIEK